MRTSIASGIVSSSPGGGVPALIMFASNDFTFSNLNSTSSLFKVFCNINGMSDVLAPQASVLLNAIMSYGRYIAVCKSLRYNSLITTRKVSTSYSTFHMTQYYRVIVQHHLRLAAYLELSIPFPRPCLRPYHLLTGK